METMNTALPESLKRFMQERVAVGRYSSVSEYVEEVGRADYVDQWHRRHRLHRHKRLNDCGGRQSWNSVPVN
jgi:Arc/MetJ-type ribon-helix-helix transcriptional regulator